MHFYDFDFSDEILDSIDFLGFENPTPIQEQTIPITLSGKDLIACAQTGTGKTAAFVLPVLQQIIDEGHQGSSTLILVPTRELAQQIDKQIIGMSYFMDVTSIAIYGGNEPKEWELQKKALTSGADIIIATPGRLISHLDLDYFKLDGIHHLVLDEADRMLDMGFFEDIEKIVKMLPKERQTLMFSATMPDKIRKLANEILQEPEHVSISMSKPAEGVMQIAYLVFNNQKINLIHSLLQGKELNRVIIFSATKDNVKQIERDLLGLKFSVRAIHSDLEQKEREEVLQKFRNNELKILVGTNIIARGIDIDNIDLVINYDVPQDAEDYVHRVGRTARAQTTGIAITFINEKEQRLFHDIETLIGNEVLKVNLPDGFDKGPEYNPEKFAGKPKGRGRANGKKPFKKKPYAKNKKGPKKN